MRQRSKVSIAVMTMMLLWQAGGVLAAPAVKPGTVPAFRTDTVDRHVLPISPKPFAGVIKENASQSTAAFEQPVKAPKEAPNILLIMTDDVGYSSGSTLGGVIPTPAMDSLARTGVLFNNFHTTGICSPTRAALLTGQNHHAVGTGIVTNLATGFPGYSSVIPKSAATVAEILKQNAYRTAMVGKWHNTPSWEESSVGPFDHWPTGMGFEYYYGVNGSSDSFYPGLFENTKAISAGIGDPNYHLEHDLADKAIGWLRDVKLAAPHTPFFLYYAPFSTHAPLQAPKEWIDKFRGKFDGGWDELQKEVYHRQLKLGLIPRGTKLAKRPDEIPAWSSLSPDEKKISARLMEVYAGMLAHVDAQIGRVIQELKDQGQFENTLILFIQGDNGGSGEGGLRGTANLSGALGGEPPETTEYLVKHLDELGGRKTQPHFPAGWAFATNAPFPWMKQIASHLGGIRNGLAVSWPNGMRSHGEIRTQFGHVVDIAPTILDAAKIPQPTIVNGTTQRPMDGTSLRYAFDDPKAANRHKIQYFEVAGNRAIYNDGWFANTRPQRMPWTMTGGSKDPAGSFVWELYDLNHDFSQSVDLSRKFPERLKEMKALWTREAERNKVFPLDNRLQDRRMGARPPVASIGEKHYVFHEGQVRIGTGIAPRTINRSFRISADVVIPPSGAKGVIAANGGRYGGWVLLLGDDGKPMFAYAKSQREEDKVRFASGTALSPGKHRLVFDFSYDGGAPGSGGNGTLTQDGKLVASGRIDRTHPIFYMSKEGLDIGQDSETPVIDDYDAMLPYQFSGKIEQVIIDLDPPAIAR